MADSSTRREEDRESCPPGHVRIFTPYITRNGKKIYPKNAAVFSFCVPKEDASRSSSDHS
jgi:hypothetical protein